MIMIDIGKDEKIIYIPLRGRIGNQLFMYAFAKQLQNEYIGKTKIVIDDSEVLKAGWVNSLQYYDLKDVIYVHENYFEQLKQFRKQRISKRIFSRFWGGKDFMEKYKIEEKWQKFLNKSGVIFCENGYLPYELNRKRDVYAEGYFQSEKYFPDVQKEIMLDYRPNQFKELETYPEIEKIRSRNTVCISVKVEHNVGSELYDVCDMEYWKKAIKYITENVENPLFFICSDNVQYVVDNLIDTNQFDYVCQSKDYPVHISLAAMNECKHFIIGNTTFGWWAQYLSKSQNKIVVAPSRWMRVEMPIDIYQEGWHLI